MMEVLSIGEVAQHANLRPSAIRYYEEMGIVTPPRRVNGRRRYDPSVLVRLRVVRLAQQAGFTVAEIRTLFQDAGPVQEQEQAQDASDGLRWRALARQKLVDVEALIARAEGMKVLLEESLRCGCLQLDACPLILDDQSHGATGRYAHAPVESTATAFERG